MAWNIAYYSGIGAVSFYTFGFSRYHTMLDNEHGKTNVSTKIVGDCVHLPSQVTLPVLAAIPGRNTTKFNTIPHPSDVYLPIK
jgi:hypothetical protein